MTGAFGFCDGMRCVGPGGEVEGLGGVVTATSNLELIVGLTVQTLSCIEPSVENLFQLCGSARGKKKRGVCRCLEPIRK